MTKLVLFFVSLKSTIIFDLYNTHTLYSFPSTNLNHLGLTHTY
ncbi:MAG: hypothetical protein Q8S84_03040 [bacterium]|nr:hypothetical protein [bacterium]